MTVSSQARHVGLSSSLARERLNHDGPNELPRARRRTPLRIAVEVLREPMLAMLMAAGGIYLLLGNQTEALLLLLFAGLSVAITIVQEARTENVLAALRDLSAPHALVMRDGRTIRVPGREVVDGDILILEQGDRIAADAVILETSSLEVDESLLTGESVPVEKRPVKFGEAPEAASAEEDRSRLFSGSMITRGSAIARVVATGQRSRIGQIGRSLDVLEAEAPRLRRETSRIVSICALGGIFVAIGVVMLYGLFRGAWLDALLAGIATAMSLLPEEFPVVLTIFLAMGAWRIAQAGVLTRRAAAIETLGAATVLCTDKTGTLTQNRMTVTELWLPSGECAGIAEDWAAPRFRTLIETATLASAPVPVDPMEIAFHVAAKDAGFDVRDGGELVHSYPLRPDLLAMSNIWRSPDGSSALRIAAKGAPEAIARLCGLEGEARRRFDDASKTMAACGMRVLGVASAAGQDDRIGVHEEHDFQLLGLIGLVDPLRPGVAEAVAQCRSAGIRVVMITGDYAATARAIADQAGIENGDLMTGDEVASLSDQALMARVGSVSVFARTMPEQKLRIVSTLKAAGEVVAMTGDGINDAPALKAAHIGIAMGQRGTDVARETAALVLVDDDFTSIVGAIEVGRRIYDNIRKALGFIFGVHVPIAGLAILPLVLGLPIILGPLQIALLEMVIDPVCALVFEAEREERRLMQRPPRSPTERLFSAGMIARGVAQGGLALALIGTLYLAGAYYGLDADRLRTLSFFGLLAAILALVLANRSFSTSLGHALLRHNISFRYVLALVALGSVLILTVPSIQHLLKFRSLNFFEIIGIMLTGLVLLIACEMIKPLFERNKGDATL